MFWMFCRIFCAFFSAPPQSSLPLFRPYHVLGYSFAQYICLDDRRGKMETKIQCLAWPRSQCSVGAVHPGSYARRHNCAIHVGRRWDTNGSSESTVLQKHIDVSWPSRFGRRYLWSKWSFLGLNFFRLIGLMADFCLPLVTMRTTHSKPVESKQLIFVHEELVRHGYWQLLFLCFIQQRGRNPRHVQSKHRLKKRNHLTDPSYSSYSSHKENKPNMPNALPTLPNF